MSKKIQISKNIKEKIWTNYFGNKSNEYCPSCMKNIITNNMLNKRKCKWFNPLQNN